MEFRKHFDEPSIHLKSLSDRDEDRSAERRQIYADKSCSPVFSVNVGLRRKIETRFAAVAVLTRYVLYGPPLRASPSGYSLSQLLSETFTGNWAEYRNWWISLANHQNTAELICAAENTQNRIPSHSHIFDYYNHHYYDDENCTIGNGITLLSIDVLKWGPWILSNVTNVNGNPTIVSSLSKENFPGMIIFSAIKGHASLTGHGPAMWNILESIHHLWTDSNRKSSGSPLD